MINLLLAKDIVFQANIPDVVQSCRVNSPENVDPVDPSNPDITPPDDGLWLPLPPGSTIDQLPVIPEIIDTSPDQMIGCIVSVADNPQGRLNGLFPSAIAGDGVIDRSTNDIWKFDGTTWENVGPTPGEILVVDSVVPPYNETLVFNFKIKSRVRLLKFDFALSLDEEVAPISTHISAEKLEGLPVVLLAALSANDVSIVIPGRINCPNSLMQVNGQLPSISTAASITVPTGNLSFDALQVLSINYEGVFVKPKKTEAYLLALSPSVKVPGAAVNVPLKTVGLNALTLTVRDPHYDDVVLLLHMEGRNGTSSISPDESNPYNLLFVDSSSYKIDPLDFDFYLGYPRISTAISKFGNSSLYLPGAYEVSSFDIAPGYIDLGADDFTIELFFYPTFESGNDQYIFNDFDYAYDVKSWLLKIDGSNRICAVVSTDGVTDDVTIIGSYVTYNSWHHVAFVRSGNTLKLFLDGILVGSAAFSGTIYYADSYVTFGSTSDGTDPFTGFIDEVRCTTLVARYEASFEVPSHRFWDDTAYPPVLAVTSALMNASVAAAIPSVVAA